MNALPASSALPPESPKNRGGLSVGGDSGPFIVTSILSSLHTAGIVLLVSEPGMGRRRLVARIAELYTASDIRVSRISLEPEANDVAANRIVTSCRDVARRARLGNPGLLCIESLPVLDEHDVMRVSRALKRLLDAGASALVVLDIENEMLVDSLPEAACYRSYLMLEPQNPESAEMAITGGIPSLVRGYELGIDAGNEYPEYSISYLDRLADLVSLSLRPTLSTEERKIRATMMLLGEGSFEDVRDILGKLDREQLAVLVRDAPFFGVDMAAERFMCVGLCSDSALLSCLPRMLGDLVGEVARGCAWVLMSRESWLRGVAIAGAFLQGGDLAAFVGAWGVEAIQAGGTDLVRRASCVTDVDERPLRPARLALSAVHDVRPSFASLPLVDVVERDPRRLLAAKRATLVCQCRKVLRDCSLAQGIDVEPDCPDTMSRELLVHLLAVGFMVSGQMTNAFHLLLVNKGRIGGTLSSELLRADFRLVGALVGDVVEDAASALQDGSDALFARSGMRSFELMQEVFESCASVLSNEQGDYTCEVLAHKADRLGDTLTQAMAVCAESLCDLRNGFAPRAHVRAELAVRLARRAGTPVVVEFAEMIDCIADACLGEDVGEFVQTRIGNKESCLATTWKLVAEAIRRMQADMAVMKPPLRLRGGCPPDERWALRALCFGIERFSVLLLQCMPDRWRPSVSDEGLPKRPPVMAAGDRRSVLPSAREQQQTVAHDEGIRICVLGGVTMKVNGKQVSDRRLRMRRAKALIAFLASTKGHTAQRHEVIDVVWPETNYDEGLSKIYQTTCIVRIEAVKIDQDLNPFVLNKLDGTIALDGAFVSCDVDDYREVAMRAITMDGNDEEVIRAAAKACELYAGDLYVPSTDPTGVMEARRRELRDMHADVMVGASEAAMRLGRTRMAARYADNAVLADNMREDAMEVLLRAYDACGRRAEAHVRYSQFVRVLADRECRPPSNSLRALAEKMWGPEDGLRRRNTAG